MEKKEAKVNTYGTPHKRHKRNVFCEHTLLLTVCVRKKIECTRERAWKRHKKDKKTEGKIIFMDQNVCF